MDARLRRIASDYEQIKKDFTGHKNIVVTPIGEEPPQKYHVTYFVNGIYLQPDGRIETLGRHEVEITLHADYPRYKPICTILTPIWHPNFRDGQICIGDIWGAGESITDIIINIGDMIQYKSWNSFSPLSADAAAWAMDNRHLFPVGDVNLYIADGSVESSNVEIDLFDEDGGLVEETPDQATLEGQLGSDNSIHQENDAATIAGQLSQPVEADDGNDFEITAEELEGIEFVPTAARMQGLSSTLGNTVKVKINFKTILVKGILWALLGAIVAFGIGEIAQLLTSNSGIASMMGYRNLAKYYEYQDRAEELYVRVNDLFEEYCAQNGLDSSDENALTDWVFTSGAGSKEMEIVKEYLEVEEESQYRFEDAYYSDFNGNEDKLIATIKRVTRISTSIWAAVIALAIGLFLGLGEGVYYGSKQNAIKYALIGAGVSVVIGGISGYLAQWMYGSLIKDSSSDFFAALVRGIGWGIMGLGIGIAIGLIKPEIKRIIFCSLGGLVGAFIGGCLFNYIGELVPNAIASRGVAIIIMGILIGIGVGLLEQFAKSAWFKVIRGEFEGKEYLIFPGTTSIGNNSNNTIVLFKDKLVGPHHCDVVMQGSKYILKDCGTPMGTVVNGMRTNQHILRQGDAIAIGNSVLVFNTK